MTRDAGALPDRHDLRAVCETAGLDHRDAVLLHARSNAVYHLPRSGVVLRLTRATPSQIERARTVVAVCRWLTEQHGALTVPVLSARAAQVVARHLAEHYPQARARWQASPHRAPDPITVFGCTQHPATGHLLEQDVHVFTLIPGQPTPPVWVALCGQQVHDANFEALDTVIGRPCPGCHQRWTAHKGGRSSRADGQRSSRYQPEPCERLDPVASQGGIATG